MNRYFSGIGVLFILLYFISIAGYSQQPVKWPVISRENKPWSRWWWQGSALNKTDLTISMQKYKAAGLGGLEVTPIYGVRGHEAKFINYLAPQWMEMLDHTLREAKRLDLGIDLATGTGWPFGGPWVKPEDACKNINLKIHSLKEGEKLGERIVFRQQPMVRTVGGKPVDIKTLSFPVASNKNLQEYAFDQVKYEIDLPVHLLMAYSDKGDSIDLTGQVDVAGTLNWLAPAGNWTLYALFQGWHGKMVERAAPGGEGDVIDHFSAVALNNYLQHLDQAFKGHEVSGIRGFFNDSYEVDDARGQSNWTPDFLAEFKNRRGYDLRQHLAGLYQQQSTEKNSRILYDYRQTISELLLEKFTQPWHVWGKSKGAIIRNQSHGSPANILDLYAVIDIPETEGTNILRYKFATSTAHVMGKPLASAEAATWLNEHFQSSLSDVKLALDKYFVGGVNHIFYHGTNYSPAQEIWPGWLFYAAVHFTPANPLWKDFHAVNAYVARVQSFLQKGKPDNDILLYFPINDRLSQPLEVQPSQRRSINAYTDSNPTDSTSLRVPRTDTINAKIIQPLPAITAVNLLQHFDGMEGFENTLFQSSAEYLLKEGYAFDLISDKQLQQVEVVDQQLHTGGVNYQTILLSDCNFISVETMEKLVKLSQDGATIIVFKDLPSQVPGFGQFESKTQRLHELLSKIKLEKTGDASVKKAIMGKGTFLTGDDLGQLLSFSKIRREAMVEKGLLFVRRQFENGNCYFISNSKDATIESWIPVSVKATGVALFDPMLKRSGLAPSRKSADGITEVFLQLAGGESCILQTSRASFVGSGYPYIKTRGEPQLIEGDWKLEFLEGGPTLPRAAQLKKPGAWTDLPGEEVKKFSGRAQYTATFKKPTANTEGWLLDLGKVSESAEVILNKKTLGTLIGPTYQLVIPLTLLKGDNQLEIIVTNGMANRISDLDKRGVGWKKFYNINFPSRLAQNRDAGGLFDASKWMPKTSGLLGPVTLTGIEYMKFIK